MGTCADCKDLKAENNDYRKYACCKAHQPPRFMLGEFDPDTERRYDCPKQNAE